jgi:hypothetical protein
VEGSGTNTNAPAEYSGESTVPSWLPSSATRNIAVCSQYSSALISFCFSALPCAIHPLMIHPIDS